MVMYIISSYQSCDEDLNQYLILNINNTKLNIPSTYFQESSDINNQFYRFTLHIQHL